MVPASDFFQGVFDSRSDRGCYTEIRVPKLGSWTGWSYLKFTRRAQDWATVGVAALVRRENGGVDDARIALTNMGATPLRAEAAEKALIAGEPTRPSTSRREPSRRRTRARAPSSARTSPASSAGGRSRRRCSGSDEAAAHDHDAGLEHVAVLRVQVPDRRVSTSFEVWSVLNPCSFARAI